MSNMSVKDIYNSTLTKVAAEVLGSDNNLGDNEDFFARLPPINSVETTMKRIRVKEEISDSSPSAKRKKLVVTP